MFFIVVVGLSWHTDGAALKNFHIGQLYGGAITCASLLSIRSRLSDEVHLFSV